MQAVMAELIDARDSMLTAMSMFERETPTGSVCDMSEEEEDDDSVCVLWWCDKFQNLV